MYWMSSWASMPSPLWAVPTNLLTTASDAGAAVANGLPLILVRAGEHVHALKEMDALATLTVETLEQAAQAVAYIFE